MIKASDCRHQYFVSVNAVVLLCDLIDEQETTSEQQQGDSKYNLAQQSLLLGALFHLGEAIRNLSLAYASDELRESIAKDVDLIVCLDRLEKLPVRTTELALLLKSLVDSGLDRFKIVYRHLFATPQNFIFPSVATSSKAGLIAVDADVDSSPLYLEAKLCRYWVERLREADEHAISLSIEC